MEIDEKNNLVVNILGVHSLFNRSRHDDSQQNPSQELEVYKFCTDGCRAKISLFLNLRTIFLFHFICHVRNRLGQCKKKQTGQMFYKSAAYYIEKSPVNLSRLWTLNSCKVSTNEEKNEFHISRNNNENLSFCLCF